MGVTALFVSKRWHFAGISVITSYECKKDVYVEPHNIWAHKMPVGLLMRYRDSWEPRVQPNYTYATSHFGTASISPRYHSAEEAMTWLKALARSCPKCGHGLGCLGTESFAGMQHGADYCHACRKDTGAHSECVGGFGMKNRLYFVPKKGIVKPKARTAKRPPKSKKIKSKREEDNE